MPRSTAFDAPFIFENAEHMMNTWDGELGDEMRALMEENGLTMIGRMGRGYRYITSNELVESVEDMHKLTIRTSTSKPYVDTLGALGAVTVPLALTELFTSLQMGVVDASEGPMDQIVGYKLYEVQDHIALSGHAYSLSCWIMNSDFYQGLDPAYQKSLMLPPPKPVNLARNLAKSVKLPSSKSASLTALHSTKLICCPSLRKHVLQLMRSLQPIGL